MKRLGATGSSHLAALLGIILVILVAVVGSRVYNAQVNKKREKKDTLYTAPRELKNLPLNATLKTLTKGIDGDFVGTLDSVRCSEDNPRDYCINFQAALYILTRPYEDNYVQLITNLSDNNWFNGQKAEASRARALYKEATSQPESLNANDAPNEVAPFLALGFDLLSRGDKLATVYAYTWNTKSTDAEAEADYALSHGVPMLDESIYAQQVKDKLKGNPGTMLLALFAN